MKRQHFIPILICLLVLNISAFAQTEEEEIQAIRVAYNRINEENHFTTKKLENDEYLDHMTDGGGELTGYYKGDTLYKITDWVGLSNGVVKDEYYFDEGKPIFVYEVCSRFVYSDSLAKFDYSKQKIVFEGRYYIHGGRLVRVIKNGTPFGRHDFSDTAMAKELLEEAKQYSLLLKIKGRRG